MSKYLESFRRDDFPFSCGGSPAGLQWWQNLSSLQAKLWSTLLKMTLP